jgi:hypothetical protein
MSNMHFFQNQNFQTYLKINKKSKLKRPTAVSLETLPWVSCGSQETHVDSDRRERKKGEEENERRKKGRKEDDGELWRHESDDKIERDYRKRSRYFMGE